MTANDLETRWQRLISPTKPVSFTDAHERLLAGWPNSAIEEEAFIGFFSRFEHARKRVFGDHPMTLERIAHTTGTPTDLLGETWTAFDASYAFPIIGGENHRVLAERWQGHVIRALDSLDAIGKSSPLTGFAPELRQPEAERKFLELLTQRPEGAAIGMAATMVLLATSPVEVEEAEARRALAEPDEPKLVRELRPTRVSGGAQGLWMLPAQRHPTVRDADVVLVVEDPVGRRLEVADPDRSSDKSVRLAGVSIARGPRAGERIGEFVSDPAGSTASRRTHEALAELARTGELSQPR